MCLQRLLLTMKRNGIVNKPNAATNQILYSEELSAAAVCMCDKTKAVWNNASISYFDAIRTERNVLSENLALLFSFTVLMRYSCILVSIVTLPECMQDQGIFGGSTKSRRPVYFCVYQIWLTYLNLQYYSGSSWAMCHPSDSVAVGYPNFPPNTSMQLFYVFHPVVVFYVHKCVELVAKFHGSMKNSSKQQKKTKYLELEHGFKTNKRVPKMSLHIRNRSIW